MNNPVIPGVSWNISVTKVGSIYIYVKRYECLHVNLQTKYTKVKANNTNL